MKAGFLLQILKAQNAGDYQPDTRESAKKLGFTMYCHNGTVYSVKNDDVLFEMSDLNDFKW